MRNCKLFCFAAAVIYRNCFYRFLAFFLLLSSLVESSSLYANFKRDERQSTLIIQSSTTLAFNNFKSFSFSLFTIISASQTLRQHFCESTFQLRMKNFTGKILHGVIKKKKAHETDDRTTVHPCHFPVQIKCVYTTFSQLRIIFQSRRRQT